MLKPDPAQLAASDAALDSLPGLAPYDLGPDTFLVHDPATGSRLARVPNCTSDAALDQLSNCR